MEEVFNNAISGINIIPTVLLVIVIFYWLTVIIGIIDIDFFDFDIDGEVDIDLDGCENVAPFHAILAFLNLRELPVMLVVSFVALFFWIGAMLVCILPIKVGGLIHGLILIPTFILSVLITKVVTNPLKGVFKKVYNEESTQGRAILGQLIILKNDLKEGRLGQGEIQGDGASLLVNVKQDDISEEFLKDEEAYVIRKDNEKDIYYIIKIKE